MSKNENVGVAFALVTGAGLATAAGAAVVFVPHLVKYAGRKTLASALGLSAGVMTYVSFVEIYQKSVDSFEESGHDRDYSKILATLCFFGGVLLMVALNALVTFLLGGQHHHHDHVHDTNNVSEETPEERTVEVRCPCCAEDPVGDLERYQQMADEIEQTQNEHHEWHGHVHTPECEHYKRPEGEDNSEEEEQPKDSIDEQDASKLMRMSINTAVAIGLHNFPEGLATFVAALNDTRVGAVLAIAIAIHNIPEGLCVAMPIYYATGQRWKAFWWALFSGLSEPLAALLGWAVLASSFSDGMYAVLFGVVAGMMVIISVRELLPTAHRYDTEDTVVTYSFMAGMAIMALSLVLFLL